MSDTNFAATNMLNELINSIPQQRREELISLHLVSFPDTPLTIAQLSERFLKPQSFFYKAIEKGQLHAISSGYTANSDGTPRKNKQYVRLADAEEFFRNFCNGDAGNGFTKKENQRLRKILRKAT
jgi:hypothetical protein